MDQRLFFPATERNRGPIGDLLETVLPARGVVLELASGSGEHAVALQQRFSELRWQASDLEPEHRRSIVPGSPIRPERPHAVSPGSRCTETTLGSSRVSRD